MYLMKTYCGLFLAFWMLFVWQILLNGSFQTMNNIYGQLPLSINVIKQKNESKINFSF